MAGNTGNKPENKKSIEWFNGPVFSAIKENLYYNFNFNLFQFYENGVGKAEDAILGFTLSKLGNINFYLNSKNFGGNTKNNKDV